MSFRILRAAFLLIALLGASPLTAGTIVYNFQGTAAGNPLGLGLGNVGTGFTVTSDGVEATVNGFTPAGADADLDRLQGFGLGVIGVPNGNSTGLNEAIEVSFDFGVVGVTALVLEGGPSDGALDYFVDGVFQERISWSAPGTLVLSALNGVQGREHRFQGVRGGFRFAEFTIMVPEPGTILLLGLGLVGARLRSRRRHG